MEPSAYKGREQTYVKHWFLKNYLERVAYNILSFRDDFVYVDGFSGPWRSEDEAYEDTSFMIAVNQLRKVRDGIKERRGKHVRMRCFFNDNDPIAGAELRTVAASIEDMEIKAVCRDFEDVVPDIVDYVGGSFSLTFIDPRGWTGYGLKKIQPLLAKRGEVIINFMFDYVNRFLEDQRPENAMTLDRLFGGPGWHAEVYSLVAAGKSREDAVLNVYRERFRQAGAFKHVTSTPIPKPMAERSYFHLVYGTRHLKGLEEFRRVEKKTLLVQETVRSSAKSARREERTGMGDLFTATGQQTGPRSSDADREKQLAAGYALLRSTLISRGTSYYEDLLGVVLEMPLVWQSDVNLWISKMHEAGEVEIPDLKGKERIPKRGYRIIWKGSANSDE